MKSITILDPNYKDWVKELSLRYRKSQIKAAVKVNREMLSFYWSVGKDITEKELWHRNVEDGCFLSGFAAYFQVFGSGGNGT